MSELFERRPQWPWHAILCTIILIVFSLTWTAQSAFASDSEVVGRIDRLPETGIIGEWKVDGFIFITSAATEFRQEKGDFAIGRCVEVEYVTVAEQTLATKVATKSEDDCTGTETPTATDTPEPEESVTPSPTHEGEDDDDTIRLRGIIETLPKEGFRGIWTIDGIQFQVSQGTHLRQKDGPIRPGACVELRYRAGTEPYDVKYLETERMAKCHRDGTPTPVTTLPAPTITPDPSSMPDDDGNEIYGILDSFPTELIGQWVIAGQPYSATADTEFEQERGLFEVGKCVKVHLSTTDSTLIREVETTNHFRCEASGDGGLAHGELYGEIQEFPADYIGEWHIGGVTVIADEATELWQRGATFAKGVIVKVHFVLQADTTFYATKIETKFRGDHHGDDDHNDVFEGAEGHAYGLIEILPDDLIGEWYVDGISYTVTSDTHFVRPHSDFAKDVRVRVKYRTDANGIRIARQIKTTNEDGGSSHKDHATLFGFVDEMPKSGYVGPWEIDGAIFHADVTTKFKESHGLLGLGSYVKVEYFTADGRNIIHEIETKVPPGAGDDNSVGEIEDIDDGGNDALHAAAINATVWTIAGEQFVVTAATDLNDFQGALEVGQQAFVNSYVADDGSQVATKYVV